MDFEVNSSMKDEYHFNEVVSLTGVKPYVLRFWETEFAEIAPKMTDEHNKVYSCEHIEVINIIKELLFEKKLSIPEAKGVLKNILSEKTQATRTFENVSPAVPNLKEKSDELRSAITHKIESESVQFDKNELLTRKNEDSVYRTPSIVQKLGLKSKTENSNTQASSGPSALRGDNESLLKLKDRLLTLIEKIETFESRF